MYDADLMKRIKENDIIANQLNKFDKHIASINSELVQGQRNKGVDLDQLARIISDYKDECQKSFQKYANDLQSKLASVDFSYRDLKQTVNDSI